MSLTPRHYLLLAEAAPKPRVTTWIRLLDHEHPPKDLSKILRWTRQDNKTYFVEGPKSVIDHLTFDSRLEIIQNV